MSPKRKYEEPTAIVYGANVPWLQPLVEAIDPTSDDKVVWESAKVAYLLHHALDAEGNLSDALQSIGAGPETPKHKTWVKKISAKQTQWRQAILHKFLFDHVKEVIRKWHVANAWKTFGALPPEERDKIWMAEYDADPEGTIVSMMKPVIGILDTSNVFKLDLADNEDRTKMRAIRNMLRSKYRFGCEITFKHRILKDRKDLSSKEWASYATHENPSNTIVPIADLPIKSKALPVDPIQMPQTKKQKSFDDELEV
ncbi:hypothetical protein P280DRAFT_546219 [Massarina eburnea CBS 473.64]|uniref:Uncharacterized protein n=1 Tax=Massarina eburnea CBS 473.64 TaxID=1395130 RepID=A0A6A6SC79_9PLEO|nr:hypothetical protein P280DRAFT_546219 [Massarina eburnea CBS 473.64]